MSGVNKVILIGRLGKDPEVRYTQDGKPVASFSVATDEKWTDKQGQKQERVEWHRIVVWGKLAELCGQYLAKGRQVYLEGILRSGKWTDKDGNERTKTEVVANQVVFLGVKSEGAKQDRAATSSEPGFDYGPPPMNDGDVPF